MLLKLNLMCKKKKIKNSCKLSIKSLEFFSFNLLYFTYLIFNGLHVSNKKISSFSRNNNGSQ